MGVCHWPGGSGGYLSLAGWVYVTGQVVFVTGQVGLVGMCHWPGGYMSLAHVGVCHWPGGCLSLARWVFVTGLVGICHWPGGICHWPGGSGWYLSQAGWVYVTGPCGCMSLAGWMSVTGRVGICHWPGGYFSLAGWVSAIVIQGTLVCVWDKLKDDINQLTTTYFHMNPNSRDTVSSQGCLMSPNSSRQSMTV